MVVVVLLKFNFGLVVVLVICSLSMAGVLMVLDGPGLSEVVVMFSSGLPLDRFSVGGGFDIGGPLSNVAFLNTSLNVGIWKPLVS